MKSPLLLGLASLGLAALAGCHRAESQAAVQHDIAEAQADAAQNEASAKAGMAKATDHAEAKVVMAAYDLAVTDAEGAHRVALAECSSLAGDAQKACRDKADATLAMAKAYAKASFAQRD